jgi:hypothetical protein
LSYHIALMYMRRVSSRITILDRSYRDVRFGSKADMCGATSDVCFGPKADMALSPSRLDDFPDLVDAVAFRHNYASAVFELALQHKLRLAV